jgi:hypothetical protein
MREKIVASADFSDTDSTFSYKSRIQKVSEDRQWRLSCCFDISDLIPIKADDLDTSNTGAELGAGGNLHVTLFRSKYLDFSLVDCSRDWESLVTLAGTGELSKL